MSHVPAHLSSDDPTPASCSCGWVGAIARPGKGKGISQRAADWIAHDQARATSHGDQLRLV